MLSRAPANGEAGAQADRARPQVRDCRSPCATNVCKRKCANERVQTNVCKRTCANERVRTGPVAIRLGGVRALRPPEARRIFNRARVPELPLSWSAPATPSMPIDVAAISSPARKPISAVTTGPNSILPQIANQPRSVFYAVQVSRLSLFSRALNGSANRQQQPERARLSRSVSSNASAVAPEFPKIFTALCACWTPVRWHVPTTGRRGGRRRRPRADFGELPSGLSLRVEDSRAAKTPTPATDRSRARRPRPRRPLLVWRRRLGCGRRLGWRGPRRGDRG